MLIINGCVRLGTDLFNHSKGLFFNRALYKFSECQYNMSFHVQKWPDIVGRTYQVKRRQRKRNKKGEKTKGGGNRKKRKEKEGRKKEGKVWCSSFSKLSTSCQPY